MATQSEQAKKLQIFRKEHGLDFPINEHPKKQIKLQLDMFPKPSDRQVGGNHYKEMQIQPSLFSWRNKLRCLEHDVVKRICRHDKATGQGIKDIKKAIHSLELIAEWEYGVTNVHEES